MAIMQVAVLSSRDKEGPLPPLGGLVDEVVTAKAVRSGRVLKIGRYSRLSISDFYRYRHRLKSVFS